jgi:hypothetical protein
MLKYKVAVRMPKFERSSAASRRFEVGKIITRKAVSCLGCPQPLGLRLAVRDN